MIRLLFSKPTDSLSSVFRYLKIFNRLKNFRPFSSIFGDAVLALNCIRIQSELSSTWLDAVQYDELLPKRTSDREVNCASFSRTQYLVWIAIEENFWARSELSSTFGDALQYVEFYQKGTSENEVNYRPFSGRTTYGLTCIWRERLNPMWIVVHFRGRVIYVELHPKPR